MKMKGKKVAIRLLGAVCTLMLILSALFVPMSFGVSAAEETVIEFDSSFSLMSALPVSITKQNATGVGVTDDYAMLFDYKGDAIWSGTTKYCQRTNLVDHRIPLCQIEDNSLYSVSYYVKVSEANTNFNIRFCTGNGGNIFEPGTLVYYNNTVKEFSAADVKDIWVKVEVLFNTTFASANKVGDDLFMLFNVDDKSESAKAKVYVDKLTVKKVSEDVVVFNTCIAGKEPIYLYGEAGEEIAFPELENEGLVFLGWYTDAEFTTAFEGTTFTDGVTALYAKWGGTVVEFDTSYSSPSSLPVSITKQNETGIGVQDDYAMFFNYKGDAVWSGTTLYHQRTNLQDHRIVITQDLKDKTLYKISYYVKNTVANTDFNIRFATGNGGNIFETGTLTVYNDTVIDFKKQDASEEWVKKELFFTTEIAVGPNKVGDDLFMLINVPEKTKEASIELYIDRVIISEVTDDVIVLNTNRSVDPVVYLMGKEGQEIVFPEIENTGLKFLGWYTDEEFTTAFEGTTFVKGVTNLYAKWGGQLIEFDYLERKDKLTAAMSIDENNAGIEDKYALKFDYKGDSVWSTSGDTVTYFYQRSNQLDHRAALCDLKDNTSYEIVYYVKVVSANRDFAIHFATGHGGNIFEAGSTVYADSKSYLSTADAGKDWIKKSVILTTKFGEAGTNAPDDLHILFTVNNQTADAAVLAYVDRVTVVELDTNAVIFNSGIVGIDNTYQKGEVGEDIVFPTFDYKNADFLGWYSDSDCEVPFTQTKIQDGVIKVYARWTAEPITFENYQYKDYTTGRFGVNLDISQDGKDDNFALSFNFNGDQLRGYSSSGKEVYWRERVTTAQDNIARLSTVVNKTAYKISFDYKINAGTTHDVFANFLTGDASNIWLNKTTSYTYASVRMSKNTTEWAKGETIIVTDFAADGGNMLFIAFTGDAEVNTNGIRLNVSVDNILIEKIDKPYIFFDSQKDGFTELVKGTAGEEIKLPATKPQRTGFDFTGWYLDKECTIPFEQTIFNQGDAFVVYAGFVKGNYALFDFEDYGFTPSSGFSVITNNASVGTVGRARSGKNAIKFDRTQEETKSKVPCVIIGDNGERYELEPNRMYAISFYYLVQQRGTNEGIICFRAAGRSNAYQNAAAISDKLKISVVAETGVWKKATVVANTADIKENYFYIYMEKGVDSIVYVDDISLTLIPKGHMAYTVENGECAAVPQYVSGPIGSSYASKLPAAPKKDNHEFIEYLVTDANSNVEELKREDMVFTKDKVVITASFVRLKTVQDFDGDYKTFLVAYPDYGGFDFDWGIYDSQADGNSKNNVTSGRYSLHREGKSMYFENAQILTQNEMLTAGQRYTVTMKVKMGKYLQTDGAIKFASCFSAYYPWAITGDYYPIVAITDLTDGNWHTVSYTFNAVEPYFSIQTPGYCEIFIDDVVIERVTKDVPISKAITFTEYIPARRDADGNLVEKDNSIDVSAIIDPSLKGKGALFGGKTINVLIVAIFSAVVLGGAVVVVIIFKKHKAKKA